MSHREVIAYQIPSTITLHEAASYFQQFGDVTKAAFDENKRKIRNCTNFFVCFADRIGASRAIAAGFITVNGNRVRVERSDTSMIFGKEERELNIGPSRRPHGERPHYDRLPHGARPEPVARKRPRHPRIQFN